MAGEKGDREVGKMKKSKAYVEVTDESASEPLAKTMQCTQAPAAKVAAARAAAPTVPATSMLPAPSMAAAPTATAPAPTAPPSAVPAPALAAPAPAAQWSRLSAMPMPGGSSLQLPDCQMTCSQSWSASSSRMDVDE